MIRWEHASARLSTRDEDGFVKVQPDPLGAQGTLPSYEVFLHGGVVFRPKSPTNEVGGNVLVFRDGPRGNVLVGTDPRWMSVLPDFGDGGAALYATTELSGTKKTPYIGFFGEGGAADEGTFRISVQSTAGTTTIEVSPSTGDVTITHPGGGVVVVKAASVELGAASGGGPLVKYTEFAAVWSTLTTNALALGLTVPPLTGVATTKVNGT